MANIPETPTFDTSVYQIETTDKVLGGPDGKINLQAKQLANRTAWLKQEVETAGALAADADAKADQALGQIADVEVAAGSAAASAAAALQYKDDALAAKALAEQAQASAEADAAAAAAATGAAADRGQAGQRAAEAQASAAAAVSAASAAVAALSSMRNLPTFADNASAIAGGLAEGYIYKTPTGEVRSVV